jgi:hypothetical protein
LGHPLRCPAGGPTSSSKRGWPVSLLIGSSLAPGILDSFLFVRRKKDEVAKRRLLEVLDDSCGRRHSLSVGRFPGPECTAMPHEKGAVAR